MAERGLTVTLGALQGWGDVIRLRPLRRRPAEKHSQIRLDECLCSYSVGNLNPHQFFFVAQPEICLVSFPAFNGDDINNGAPTLDEGQ